MSPHALRQARAPASASDRLSARKEKIIELWEARICSDIPATKEQTERQLRNSVPKFIDQLARALSADRLRPVGEEELRDVSEDHAQQRVSLKEYSLHQVLKEYQLLQEAIFRVLEEEGPLSAIERDIILSAIGQGMAESLAQYMIQSQARERAAEERIRLVVEGVKDYAILRIDPNGMILNWNTGAENIFQYKKEEILGKDARKLFTPEDLARGALEAEMKQAANTGKAEDKGWHLKKDGSRFSADGVMNPLRDEVGEILGFVKVLRDETARKEAETIRENFFSLPDLMLCIAGTDGYFKQLNSAWEPTLGWTNEELTSRPWLDFVHPEDHQKTIEASNRLTQGELVVGFRNRYRHKNDGYRTFDWTARPVGKDRYCVARDVTELVEAEQALRASEARFRTLLETLPHIVWKIDTEGKAEFFSRMFEKFTGRTVKEVLGRKYDLVIYPDDLEKTENTRREAKERRGSISTFERLRRADGVYRWHHARGEPVFDESGELKGWIGATTDVHDQKVAHEKLLQERELRERFVATLSHDLRTPLAAARMAAQMLVRGGDHVEFVHETASRITKDIDRADQMIHNLLDANRIKAGEKLPIEISQCNLVELVKDTIKDLATIHGDRFIVDTPALIEGYWSHSGIRRILENLCDNGVKYGAVDRPVTVSLRKSQQYVVMSVHNYGPTISPEDQKKLFDPFRRTPSAQTSRQRGWGLGLTLVKGIAEAHGGRVEVKSLPDQGTTFSVVLPLDAR